MKYLIVSEYQYYDSYDISNVCICDTRERAEQLVKEFNAQKEQFKLIKGYTLYLKRSNEDQLKHFSGFFQIELPYENVLFINSDNFEHYKEHLVKFDYHKLKSTYFDFITEFGRKISTIESKFCNDRDATLEIYEIQEM